MTSKKQKKSGYPIPEQIEDNPLIAVCGYIPDATEFRAAFRGAINELGKWWVWEKSYEPDDRRATRSAQVWREALLTFRMGDDCEKDCWDFPPSSDFIQWFPHDPFTDPYPDPVPEGYNQAPWYIVSADDPIWGTKTGDVATDLTRFPPGSLPSIIPASGLPRFRLNLKGTGTVEIHMPNMFAGSIAQITINDDPLTVKLIDLTRDTLSVPPETGDVVIWEVEITQPGENWIDVIIVSKANDEFPFLYHGGGLRKVVLCGFDEMFEDYISDWIAENLRFEFQPDCGLYYSIDGGENFVELPGWSEFATNCFKGEPGEPGEPGQPGSTVPDPGSYTDPDEICDAAGYLADKTIELLTDLLTDLQTLTLQEVLESLLTHWIVDGDLAFQLIAYLELQNASAIISELSSGRDDLKCDLYCNELSKESAAIWADTYVSWSLATRLSIRDLINTLDLGQWALWAFLGSKQDSSEDCTSCDCGATWCYTWDFKVSDGGWVAHNGLAVWESGKGWVPSTYEGGGFDARSTMIHKLFSGQVTEIHMVCNSGGNYIHGWRGVNGSETTFDTWDFYSSGVWNGSELHITGADYPVTNLLGVGCSRNSLPVANSAWAIESVTLRGTGNNPFGSDNCT